MIDREIVKLLGGDGPFMVVPGYSPRNQQIELASEIKKIINDGGALLAEAGTGTGKSFAALVPVMLSGKRAVVATASIALQEQYLNNDIPKLKTILNKENLKVALLKGRGNFVCRANAVGLDHSRLLTHTQKRIIKLLSETGDRSDLKESVPDSEWQGISAGHDDDCLGKACSEYDTCYYYKQRDKALRADLVIANYHILFVDSFLMGNEMLGPYQILIADEAHRVPEIARNFLELKISHKSFDGMLSKLAELNGYTDLFAEVESLIDGFDYQNNQLSEMPTNYPLDAEVFSGFRETLESIQPLKIKLARQIEISEMNENTKAVKIFNAVASKLSNINEALALLIDPEDTRYIRWILPNQSRTLKMQMLDVTEPLSALFGRIPSTILMSATLRTSDGFGFIQREMGLPKVKTLALSNVFNFKTQVRFHAPEPSDMPDPSGERALYIDAVVQQVGDIVSITQGRTLALFTSVETLKKAQESLVTRFPGLHIYTQGDLVAQKLVEKFKRDPQAVLLGTRTFFEGIDVPGDALSCVILDRFPFQQLGDPLIQARQQRDPKGFYLNWYLPSALIVFKQAFGRLIRTKTDRGVFIILDPRVKYKYHKAICKTLQEEIPICEWSDVKNFLERLIFIAKNDNI